MAAGLVARGREGLGQRGVAVGAGHAQAEIAGAHAACGLHRRHGAGFPHERATLHVALRRQRRQAGRQGAPGQLGGLLAARVAGAPGQVDLGQPRRRRARGLGEDGAGDGVAAQVAVAGARRPRRPGPRPRRRRGPPPAGCRPRRRAPRRGARRAPARPRARAARRAPRRRPTARARPARAPARAARPARSRIARHALVALGVLRAREREGGGHLDEPRRQRAGQRARRAPARRGRLGRDLFEELSQRAVGERGHRPIIARASRGPWRARARAALFSRPWAAPGSSSCPRAGREPSPPPRR